MIDKFFYNFFGKLDNAISFVETYSIKLTEWCWHSRVKILKRKTSIEKFIYNYKYNFKLIYVFGFSSSIMEISYFCKKENLRALDISDWIDNKGENFYRKKGFKVHYKYLRKQKINIIKLKMIKNLN